MAITYEDGAMLTESFEVEISGQTYIVNNLSQTGGVGEEITRTGIDGTVYNGGAARVNRERFEFTADIQINTAAQNQDINGETVTIPLTHSPTAAAMQCLVRSSDREQGAGTPRTASVNLVEKIDLST